MRYTEDIFFFKQGCRIHIILSYINSFKQIIRFGQQNDGPCPVRADSIKKCDVLFQKSFPFYMHITMCNLLYYLLYLCTTTDDIKKNISLPSETEIII